MKGNAKFEECRQMLNSISTLLELEEILKVYGKINNGEYYNYITINDWTIGWSYDNNSIYVLSGKELIDYSKLSSGADPILISFILDEVLKLDTDEFYKFFFRKYGYDSIISECKSKVVKDILNQFVKSKARIKNIFVSENYTSVTVSGVKRNGTDFECNVMYCDRSDIIELIELTRIKPHINKITLSTFNVYTKNNRLSNVTSEEIMDSYNEYKDCEFDQSVSNDDVVDDTISVTFEAYDNNSREQRTIEIQQDCITCGNYSIYLYDQEEDCTWACDRYSNPYGEKDVYKRITEDISYGRTNIDLHDIEFSKTTNSIKED